MEAWRGNRPPYPTENGKAESIADPRIAVALDDHWACALVCAELREDACDASCVDRVAPVLLLSEAAEAGSIRAVVLEREHLRERDVAALKWSRAIDGEPAVLLLAAAGAELPSGPWDLVMRRPVTLGALLTLVMAAACAGVGHDRVRSKPLMVPAPKS